MKNWNYEKELKIAVDKMTKALWSCYAKNINKIYEKDKAKAISEHKKFEEMCERINKRYEK
jgi:hypothetical protein